MLRLVHAVAFLWSVSTASSFGVIPSNKQSSNPLAFVRRGGQQNPTSSSPLSAAVTSDLVTQENLQVLSVRGRQSIQSLLEHDTDGAQAHVYGSWPAPGTDDEGKQKLAEQVGTAEL